MTKEQAEEIIEKLAGIPEDCGCKVKKTYPRGAAYSWTCSHTVLIGDALEKMKEMEIGCYTKNEGGHGSCCDEIVDNEEWLLEHWGAFSFTSSLQEILDKAEWVMIIGGTARTPSEIGKMRLKAGPALDLFTFLSEIL